MFANWKVAAPGNNISLPLVSPFLKAQQKKKSVKNCMDYWGETLCRIVLKAF